jgi:hypothetical protein
MNGRFYGGAEPVKTITAVQRDKPKRLNFNLTADAAEEVRRLSQELGTSMTAILRFALGLVKIVIDERKANHKIIVTTSDGHPLKELVLPL